MAFVPVPLCAQVEIRCSLHGSRIENVLWFRAPTEWTAAALGDLCLVVADNYNTLIRPLMSTDVELREVYATAQYSRTGPFSQASFTPGLNGSVASTVRNSAESLCVKLLTENRGRSFRGRLYQFGLPSANLDDSLWSDATASGVVAAWNTFRANMVAEGFPWVVVSRRSNNQDRPVGIATPVTLCSITDRVVDSQRRRLPSRGE